MAKNYWRRSWIYRRLVSVRFFTSLMLLLALVLFLGALLPPAEYSIKYISLDLANIFQSWWFFLLAGAFSLSLIVCGAERLVLWYTLWPKKVPVSNQRLNNMRYTQEKLLPGNALKVMGRLAEYCGQRGFKLKAGVRSNCWVATKGYNYTLVSLLQHFGIFLCVLAFSVSYLFNYEGEFSLAPGASITINLARQQSRWSKLQNSLLTRNSGQKFTIQLTNFSSEYNYQDGQYWLKGWFSDLVVSQGLAVKRKVRLGINEPLRYEGVVFYQQRCEQRATLAVLTERGALAKQIVIEPNKEFTIPGINGQFSLEEIRNGLVFYPDKAEEKIGPEFTLTSAPSGVTRQSLGTLKLNQPRLIKGQVVVFQSFAEKSGFYFRYDPGSYLLWPAALLLILGMLLRIYRPYYRILLVIDQVNSERTHVKAGLEAKGLFAREQRTLQELFSALNTNSR